jgi:uncharacterized membrane protein
MIPRYGREVSRIEGFSDAVFGFALTLLVVALEVPDNFDGLKQILRGFIPFAATFALVCWIWFEHYAFFRKFEAEDALTIFLNCVLLFLVLGTSIAAGRRSVCLRSRPSSRVSARGRTC